MVLGICFAFRFPREALVFLCTTLSERIWMAGRRTSLLPPFLLRTFAVMLNWMDNCRGKIRAKIVILPDSNISFYFQLAMNTIACWETDCLCSKFIPIEFLPSWRSSIAIKFGFCLFDGRQLQKNLLFVLLTIVKGWMANTPKQICIAVEGLIFPSTAIFQSYHSVHYSHSFPFCFTILLYINILFSIKMIKNTRRMRVNTHENLQIWDKNRIFAVK